MPIIKIPHTKDNPYVVMDQRPLNDWRLSWKAKGLLAYLLSKPPDWQVWVADLMKRSTDGEYAVRTAIQALIEYGYIEKHQVHLEDGTFGPMEYIVREEPLSGFPHTDYPYAGFPDAGNHGYTNKDSTSIDSTSIEQETPTPSTTQDEPQPHTFQGWKELLRETKARHGNVVAILVGMHNTLYPEHDPVQFGRIGKTAKRVGGVMRCAQLLWENSTRAIHGSVCDYIEGVAKGQRRDEGRDPDEPMRIG